MDTPIYLAGCRSTLGRHRDIGELPLDSRLIEELRAKGVTMYSDIGDFTVPEMAGLSIGKTLASTGIDPGAVDTVVFCTSSYWHHPQLSARALGRMLCGLGLQRAELIMTSVMGCHNAATGVRIARSLIASEGKKNAIVVTADISHPEASRIGDGPSVLGDGSASCLLSAERRGEYRLVDVAPFDHHELHQYESTGARAQLFFVEWLRGVRRVAGEILSRNGLRPADIALLVPNNYNLEMSQRIAASAGVDPSRVAPFNHMSGHVWASDTIIGLENIENGPGVKEGERVMMITTGPQNFGAILLERTAS